jgi:hypothetical protein
VGVTSGIATWVTKVRGATPGVALVSVPTTVPTAKIVSPDRAKRWIANVPETV